MADPLTQFFSDRENRLNTLPEQARSVYQAMPDEERDVELDKKGSSMWLSKHLAGDLSKQKDIYDNFDQYAQTAFGTSDPAQVYSSIAGHYQGLQGQRVKSSLTQYAKSGVRLAQEEGGASMLKKPQGLYALGAAATEAINFSMQADSEETQRLIEINRELYQLGGTSETDTEERMAGKFGRPAAGVQDLASLEEQLVTSREEGVELEDLRAGRRQKLEAERDKLEAKWKSRISESVLKDISDEYDRLSELYRESSEGLTFADIPDDVRDSLFGQYAAGAGSMFQMLATSPMASTIFLELYARAEDEERASLQSQGKEFKRSVNLEARIAEAAASTFVERALGAERVLAGVISKFGKGTASLTVKEFLKQAAIEAAKGGVGETADEMVQGTLAEARKKLQYEEDFDMNVGDFIKRRGLEALIAAPLGALMGGGVSVTGSVSTRSRIQKQLMANDGTPFGFREMTNPIRKVRTDEELMAMGEELGVGDAVLKAANGDQAAYQQYREAMLENIPETDIIAGDYEVTDHVVFKHNGKTYINSPWGTHAFDENNKADVETLKDLEAYTGNLQAARDQRNAISGAAPRGTYARPVIALIPSASGGGAIPIGRVEAPTQKAQGGKYLVINPETSEPIGEFETKTEANEAAWNWQEQQLSEKEVSDGTRATVDNLLRHHAGQTVEYVERRSFGARVRAGEMTEEQAIDAIVKSEGGQTTREEARARLDTTAPIGSSTGALRGLQTLMWIAEPVAGDPMNLSTPDRIGKFVVLGASNQETERKLTVGLNRIAQGASPYAAIEEFSESYLKLLSVADGARFGSLSPAVRTMVVNWRRAIDDELTPAQRKVMEEGYDYSDNGLIEWFSSRVIDYANSSYAGDEEQKLRDSMPEEVRGFVALVRRFAKVLWDKAEVMLKLRRDGKLPEDFEGSMREVLGMPTEYTRKDIDGLRRAGYEIVQEPMATGSTGETFQTVRNTEEQAFYSQMERVLDQKIQGKSATVQQVKGLLDPKNGIKADEIKWSGIEQWLDDNAENGKVSTADLMAYVRDAGRVKFEEVKMGGGEVYSIDFESEQAVRDYTFGDEMLESSEGVLKKGLEIRQLPNGRWNLFDPTRQSSDTQYSEYVLPNGENYREVVLTMPSIFNVEEAKKLLAEGQSLIGMENGEPVQRVNNESEIGGITEFSLSDAESYTSSHFRDIPNYVAHMRLNERTDSEGNDGLFIEEIQSDRHQQGRERGYKGEYEQAYVDLVNEFVPQANRAEITDESNKYGFMRGALTEEGGRLKAFGKTEDDARKNLAMHLAKRDPRYSKVKALHDSKDTAIADAPFRKDWNLQMFKRALRDAVASGKDWIGWTVGETQAERYDLSKQVDYIDYGKRGEALTVSVHAFDGSELYRNDNASEQELSDTIGKDLTKKIIEGAEAGVSKRLTGTDLKLGGEGMKGFYDKMLPSAVNKYVKKWGAKVEVGSVNVDDQDRVDIPVVRVMKDGVEQTYYDQSTLEKRKSLAAEWIAYNQSIYLDATFTTEEGVLAGTEPIHKVQITDAMRESVAQGQPTYQTVTERGGNLETERVAQQYMREAGIDKPLRTRYVRPDVRYLQDMADYLEDAPNDLDAAGVREAYQSLADETRAQYDFMVAAGIEIEPYTGKGEPYASSVEMMADVRDNKHLWFFTTEEGFGSGAQADPSHPLLQKTGVVINDYELAFNDLFRAVHDYFGHTKGNFQFGARGEYNAFLAHADMFTDAAIPALAAETLAQNAWVNYGKHIRRDDRTMPKKGEADFKHVTDRPFANQKTFIVPMEMMPEELSVGLEQEFTNQVVEMRHYSRRAGLETLDPAMHGTGLVGKEKERKRDYPELYQNRVYVGLEGYEKEQGLGNELYVLDIEDSLLYDIATDPDGLYAQAASDVRQGKTGYAPFDKRATFTLFEKMVKDAGHLGITSPSQNMAALFHPVPTTGVIDQAYMDKLEPEDESIELIEEGDLGEDVSTDILDADGTEIDWSTNQVVVDPSAYPTMDEKIKAEIKAATNTIGTMHIDRIIAGGDFDGTPLQGGMFYSAIEENLENEVVWAFNSLGTANDVIARAKANGGYLGLTLMEEGNVSGNKTFATIWFNELKKAISEKRTSKTKALKALNAQRVKSSKLKTKIKFPDNHKRAWKTIEEAERAIIDMGQIARGVFYFSRGKADTAARGKHTTYGLLSSKKLSGELGMPTVESLVKQLEEPAFSGLPADSVVGVIYIDPNQEAMSAEDAGVTPHLSYGYVVKGRPVAKLAKAPVLTEHYPELKNRLMSAARFQMPVDMVANLVVTDEQLNEDLGTNEVVQLEAEERAANEQRDKMDAPYWNEERVMHQKYLEQLEFDMPERSFIASSFAKYGMSMGTRLRNVNIRLFARTREHRLGIHQRIAKYIDQTEVARTMFKDLTKDERLILGTALANRDDHVDEGALAVYEKHEGLREAIAEVRKMLAKVKRYAVMHGFEVGELDNYWPRWLKELDKFLTNEFGIKAKGQLDRAVAEVTRTALENNVAIDEEDIMKAVSNVLAGLQREGAVPSNFKGRSIDYLDPKWFKKYYALPFEAVDRYVTQVVEKVERKKFFGKAAVMDESTGVRKLNLSSSAAGLVTELIGNEELNPAEQEEVIAVIQALHTKQPMHEFIQRARSLGYITTMMKPEVAMVNFEDITSAIFSGRGVGNLRYFASLFDKDEMSIIRDFGVESISQDHEDAKKSLSNFMNWGMKYSGVAFLGRGGANAQVNSGVRAYKDAARRGKFSDTQERRLVEFFGGDLERIQQLKADLKDDVKSEDVVLLGWNILLDFQPMDYSEMPEGYAKAGNYRIFYMLKTFMLKRWDIMRREGVREMRLGADKRDYKLFMGGLRKLMWLYLLYLMGGSTVDFIRDTISGKEPTMDDAVYANSLKVLGMNRYIFFESRRVGVIGAGTRWVLPPAPYIDYPMRDMAAIVGAKDKESPVREMLFGKADEDWSIGSADSWRLVPFIGGLYDHYYGGSEQRMREKEAKERRRLRRSRDR